MGSNLGKLTLTPDSPVAAGSFGAWTFELSVGEQPLQAGDTLEIVFFTRFSTNLWSMPQTHDPTAPGFVTARGSDGGFVYVEVYRIPSVFRPHGVTMHIIKATLGGDSLSSGQSLSIVYGDQTGGSPGAQAQFLAREVVFPVFIGAAGPDGSKDFARAMQSIWRPTLAEVAAAAAFTPSIRVIGGEPASFGVFAPSIVGRGARVPVKVRARDVHGNSASYSGSPEIMVQVGEKELQPRGAVSEVELDSPGTARIIAVDSETRLMGTSAPVVVSETPPELKLYWGEIHAHTIFSDALGQIDEHFDCAIDNGSLDFGAISDHDTWMERNPESWEIITAKTRDYNKPGEFVALLGYEMLVHASGRYSSHANIYFPGDAGPMLARMDVEQVLELCRKHGAIAIPHHTQYGWPRMGTNWDDWAEFTPEEMPVVEIFSTHGNSEYFGCPRSVLWPAKGQSVQDGLARGRRFGFIGGSDYHESLLGHPMDIAKYTRTVNNRHMQARSGLTAVYAPELTREAIFDAIKRRRVYATSGERIVLDFRVNGTPMGSETASSGGTRKLDIQAHGTRKLAAVEIIRNREVVHADHPRALDFEFTWEDTKPVPAGTYYYLRVTQTDGEQAWTSPVWVGENNP